MIRTKKLILISFTILLSLFWINVNAEELTGTTTGAVHVRKGPGTNFDSVVTLSKGKAVTLVSSTLVPDQKGCAAGWYQINYNGSTERYICSTYVNLSNSSVSYFTQESWAARTNSNSVTVRKGAGTSYASQGSLIFGTEVKILSEGKINGVSNKLPDSIDYYDNITKQPKYDNENVDFLLNGTIEGLKKKDDSINYMEPLNIIPQQKINTNERCLDSVY